MLSNSTDEPPPPYLVAGTEVSAKFKGAFCEAKITRVEKNVRCKITYKHNGQQATVSDEQIRSTSGQMLALKEFRIGMTIQVVKNSTSAGSSTDELNSSNHTLALLNKVIDQSAYTVIFNDGDEKILRRSFIRFKGEKHYLDSETLNNAPLNNPEHFLYPIKHNNSTDNVLSPSTTSSSSKTKSSPLNQVKRATTANQSEEDESEDENKSETTKKPKKPVVKRRTISVDESEEQQHSDQNKNSGDETSDADSDCSSSSDDFPSEVKDRFVAQLYKFMDDRGTPMNRLPTINCVDIDLHRFFIVVRRFGGYNKVCKLRNWIDVYKRLNLPNVTHSSNIVNLKCAYKRYLQPFEDFYRKLGSTMVDFVSKHVVYNTNSAKRNTSDSHRSLQLFKNRVYTPNNTTQKKGLSKYKQQKQAAAASASTTSTSALNTSQNVADTTITELKIEKIERKESVDSTVESIETIKTEEIKETALIKSPELDPTQSQTEELTLSSMVRNLNENYKKARLKEKEINKKFDDDSTDKEIKQESVSSSPMSTFNLKETPGSNNKKTSKLVKTSEQKILNKKKPSSSSISSSSSTTSSSSTKANENNNDDDDDDSLDDITKPKRKVNRLSVSGSEENQIIQDTKKKLGMKRKNSSSTNLTSTLVVKSSTASSETNDESENEKDDSVVNETDFKSVLSIGDLEVNKIVDVKYINGSQKRDYPAKIMQINTENQTVYVHYLGWNTRYDEWIKLNRIKRMADDNFSPKNKRRKSIKIKPSNQSASSPSSSSSVSSHLNESSPTINKSSLSALNSITTKTKSTEVVVLKINERSSSTSTTSSLCTDQVKEEFLDSSTITTVTTTTTIRNNNDLVAKVIPDTDVKCQSISENNIEITKIEDNIIETTSNGVVVTNGDSLLSIKEEIIELEQTEYTNTTIPHVTISNSTTTVNAKVDEIITDEKTKTNLKVETKLNNQENLKSQLKSPKETTRQITPHQSSTSSDNVNTKVLNNQTNQINETPTETNEDDLKKKQPQPEEKKAEKPECIDNCKYSFNLNDINLLGKQRIRYIEEQMKVCREVYAKLKNEIAAIDRKKKKQNKRHALDATNNSTSKSVYSNCGLTSSASSSTNDDTITMTPKALKS